MSSWRCSARFKRLWDAEVLPQVPIAMVNDLPVGGARVFHYPASGDPCLLVRLDVDRYVAYRAKVHAPGMSGVAIAPLTGSCTVHATRGSSMLPTAGFWQVHRRGHCRA